MKFLKLLERIRKARKDLHICRYERDYWKEQYERVQDENNRLRILLAANETHKS